MKRRWSYRPQSTGRRSSITSSPTAEGRRRIAAARHARQLRATTTHAESRRLRPGAALRRARSRGSGASTIKAIVDAVTAPPPRRARSAVAAGQRRCRPPSSSTSPWPSRPSSSCRRGGRADGQRWSSADPDHRAGRHGVRCRPDCGPPGLSRARARPGRGLKLRQKDARHAPHHRCHDRVTTADCAPTRRATRRAIWPRSPAPSPSWSAGARGMPHGSSSRRRTAASLRTGALRRFGSAPLSRALAERCARNAPRACSGWRA